MEVIWNILFYKNGIWLLLILILISSQVIFGEEREQTGSLLSIDHNEGVVKLDHADVKMLQLRYLCKMKKWTTICTSVSSNK